MKKHSVRLSKYFIPLKKESPHGAHMESHKLMLRAGLVMQHASGLYSWLPLGLRVVEKMRSIIKKHMERGGFAQMMMPCMQPARIWEESGRIDDYGQEMLKATDRAGHILVFGPSNEEMATDAARAHVRSYRDLPLKFFHIQEKFRDEIRPRHGVMRSREFIMKDGYSFHADKRCAEATYFEMFDAYYNIFSEMGLNAIPARAASGPIGGELNHEFHIICKDGDSKIYYDEKILAAKDAEQIKSFYSAIDEIHEKSGKSKDVQNLKESTSIEVGHIFYFGDKYSAPMNASFTAPDGQEQNIHMGSYGIGISRLVAASIEANADERGVIWPEEIAPFKISLINITPKDEASSKIAEKLYKTLASAKLEVLYDDTAASAGSKFASHDLIGSPYQVIIGKRLAASGEVEVKMRSSGKAEIIPADNILKYFARAD